MRVWAFRWRRSTAGASISRSAEGISAVLRSGISGWRDRALCPLAGGSRAARRIGLEVGAFERQFELERPSFEIVADVEQANDDFLARTQHDLRLFGLPLQAAEQKLILFRIGYGIGQRKCLRQRPESFVSPEMAALQGELDHCRQVGLTLFGFMGDDESEL
jgi:hypothetical protein